MCLLIVVPPTDDTQPLVVAANRDERLDRPARAMEVLRDRDPRILGGRDELAGGTWLAVNEHGVVAGLTNRPASTPGLRDPDKRSRGELPLALASHRTALDAVDEFASAFRPSEFNPSWLVVADRRDIFTIDMAGDTEPVIEPVTSGIVIVENSAPGTETLKVAHVRALLDAAEGPLSARLRSVVACHVPAPGAVDIEGGRPAFASAPCVHSERYGTRWSGLVEVPATGRPAISYTDGPPCTATWEPAKSLWRTSS